MPNPNNEDIKWLYGKLKSKGYNIGSEQEFTSSLANDADRQWYYEKAKGMGLNIGSMDDFNSLYAPAKPQPTHQTQAQPAKPQPKVSAPVHSATPQPAKPQQAAPVRQQPVTYFRLRRGGKDFNVSADEVRKAGGLQAWANRHPGAPVRVYMQGNGFNGHVDLSQAHNRLVTKGYKYSTTTAQKPVQTASKPVKATAPAQRPKPVANAMTEAQKAEALANAQGIMNDATATLHQAKQQMKNMQEYAWKAGFGRSGQTVEGAKEYNPATGKMERTYITPQGEKTRSKAAADMSSEKFRQKEEFFGRMTENGLDPQKQEDVQRQMQLDAEKPMRDVLDNVWGEAEAQDKRAQEAWRNGADKKERGFSMSDAAMASNSAGAMYAGRGEDFNNDLEYQKQRHSIFDFDKMANTMYARLPEDYRNSTLARYTDYFKKHPKAAKGKTAAVAAKDALMGDLYRQVYDRAKAQSMPKSRLDFLLRKIADQPLISSSMAANTVAAWQTGSHGLDLAEQDAMSVYGSRHKALNIAGTVANMALDPVTYAAGGVGGVVGKKALQVVGKQALKGATKKAAERYAAGTLAGRVAQGVAGGAANFGTFNTVKGIQQQMAVGGTLDENGKPTNELSAGDILKETAHGLMLGAATGTLSPLIGNVADKAVKATSSTAGKVALRAGQTAVSTLAEGTVFAIPDMVDKGKWDWDTWTDSQAMMLGFKASHAIKSAPRVLDALRTDGKRYGLSFEERLRKQMDASPSDVGFKPEELDELRDKGYVDLSMLFRNANNTKKNAKSTELDRRTDPYENLAPDTFDGYEAMKQLMNDNSVSEATRAKAYYILTGHMLPMSTVTGYTQDRADDGSVVVNSVNARGGVVTTRRFANEQAAQQEKDNIMRQAELNSVTVGEKYKETASNMMVVEQAIKEVAPDADVATVMNNYVQVKDGRLTDEAYVKQAQAIDEAIERNRHIADPNRPEAIRENIKKETGIDVDATLRKMPAKRSEKEQAVVDEYVRSLFPEQKRNENETEEQPTADEAADAEFNNRLEQRQQSYDEGRAAFETADTEGDRSDSDAIMQRVKEAYEEIDRVFGEDAEMRLAQLEDDPWEVAQDESLTEEQQDAVAYFINAKAAMDGLTDAANDNAENKRADIDRKVEQHTNKQTGMIHPATLKVDNRPVYIVSGNVVMFPDGSGVDKANSSESVVICDAETGEVKFVSPDMIYSVEKPISADQERQAAYDAIESEQQVILGSNEPEGQVPEQQEQEPEQQEQEPEQPQFTQEGIDNAFNADLAQRTGADANLQSEDLQNAAAQQAQYIQQNIDNQRQQQTEADAQRHAAEEQEMAKPLYRIPKDDNGTPMLEETDPETAWDGVVQYMDDNADDASEYVNGMVTQLTKDVENAKKAVSKIKPTTDLAAFKQAKAEARQAQADAEARLDKWQQIANVNKSRKKAERDRIAAERAEADRIAHEEANARLVEQKRIEAEKKAEQEAIGTHAVNPTIKAKWDQAPKVVGNADIITLPDGSQLRGHYVLTESGAATASHDVNNGYQPTEGFPIDENGQSVNDRDYARDKEAQGLVRSIADSYDNRALQSPVIVSRDGIVLSGNNRTMSGDLAARNNTDASYNDYVREFGQKYGFDADTVNGMKHPRVLFVPDEQLPYDAKTFARFNAQEMKSQSKPEAAVKLGKIVPEKTFGHIVNAISKYDRLPDFYANENEVNNSLRELVSSGVINDKQLPELRTGNALSAQGKELLENILIGKVFQSNPDAVRQIISHPSLKQTIVMALGEIANNRTLASKQYDLSEELGNAVDLVCRAKDAAPDIYREGMPVSPFGRQHGLFDDEYGDSTVKDATTLLLADVLNSSKPSDLRKILATYNNEAVQSANGQLDIFSGRIKTKEELLKEINQRYINATPKEQQALVDAAIEERKRRSAESEQANASETGSGQTAPEGSGQSGTGNGTTVKGQQNNLGEEELATRKDNLERIHEWLTPENMDWARGKSREENFDHFGNKLEPVSIMPKAYLPLFEAEPTDDKVYSGKGYFIDHAVNHHANVPVSEYDNIQEVLDRPDSIKKTVSGSIAFIKKLNQYDAVLVDAVLDENGRILLHKTFFSQKKEPYAKEDDMRPERMSREGGASSISHADSSAPAISLESRRDNGTEPALNNGPSTIGKDNKSSDTMQEKKEEIASEGEKSKEDEDGLTDDERALRGRTVVNEDDWEEPGEYGPVYKRTITIDGKHDVTQVNAPDEKGDYTGAYYEFNGKRYSDLLEVTKVIDGKAPIGTTTDETTKQAEREKVNTQPSDAQKEAGNYAKGHIKVDGYDVTIENPKGSTRSGKDANGKEWSIKMNYDYGYIRGTEGVDGDHIDVYLSDNPTSGNVYVVDQVNQEDGTFDEHKVMYGFPSMEAAVEAYKGQYKDGWKVGTVTEVSREDFKKWVESSKRKTKPFADYKSMETVAKQQRTEPGVRTGTNGVNGSHGVNGDKGKEKHGKTKQKAETKEQGEEGKVVSAVKEAEKRVNSISSEIKKVSDDVRDKHLAKVIKMFKLSGKEAVTPEWVAGLDDAQRKAYDRREKLYKKELEQATSKLRVELQEAQLDLENARDARRSDEVREKFIEAIKPKEGSIEARVLSAIENGDGYDFLTDLSPEKITKVKNYSERLIKTVDDMFSDDDADAADLNYYSEQAEEILGCLDNSDFETVKEDTSVTDRGGKYHLGQHVTFEGKEGIVYGFNGMGEVLVKVMNGSAIALSPDDGRLASSTSLQAGAESDGVNGSEAEPTGRREQDDAAAQQRRTEPSGKKTEEKPTAKRTPDTKIEDVGEHLAGARKDMRKEIAKSLANVTEAALVEKPFGKVYKKPDLKKAVESGALREKDAIFYEALFSMVNQQKPKVTQSEMRSKRYIPDHKTKAERWAADTFKQMEVLRQFMELDEPGRDAMMERMLADRYPTREQELAEIEKRKGWNQDYEGHKYEWGEMTTPNPLWVTHEVMNRLGYSVGDKLDVPYGVVKANMSGTGYSIENLKGERASLFGSSMSIDEAIDTIVYLSRLKRGDADISHPTQLFAFPATKSEMGESGRYRVMWGRDYKTREFGSKEEADAFAATKSGAYVSPINEVKRRFGYKVRFTHPLTGEKMFVDDAEFDTKEEAEAYLADNFDKINGLVNDKLQEESEKRGEKKTLTADEVVHATMVRSSSGKWVYAVVIDKKYANNDGQVRIIKEGFASRKDAQAFADSVKDDVLKTVLKHKEEAKKIVYFDTGENSRIGEDYRNGKNVDAEDFMNTFGFRGVQFGNWTNQEDRQMALNQAYDALMDLANVIGVSPQAISLNGELGIAFGSRGSGNANAHYEPNNVVINLTKTRGAGSLAHEWWHALDNYFARRVGRPLGMVTDNREIAMRAELREAFNNMLDLVEKSDYARRSRARGEYWGSMHEITARLLSEWIDNELKKRSELNTFLARGANVERWQRYNYKAFEAIERIAGREHTSFEDFKERPESLSGFPYPSTKEVEQFGASLRHIFDTIEERVDEKTGMHALLSKVRGEAKPVSEDEAALRDAVMDLEREAGLDVIDDVEEGQRVLDMANGRVRQMSFGEPYDYDAYPLGRVEPNLAEKEVAVVEADANHGFANYKEAKAWAKQHVSKVYNNEETGGKGDVRISNAAIDKFMSQSAVDKSDGKDVHMSVLKVLPEVLKNSIDVETHPDFLKGADGKRRPENGMNKDVLVHRCYGAVSIDGKPYRVKITLKEDPRDVSFPHVTHSYEATKIELLAGTWENQEGPSPNTNNSIPAANLLKNVGLSYNPSEKVLAASEKRSKSIREQRVYHGSASDFDAFDTMNHLSEGEGNQAFGAGTYVADQKNLGVQYANIAYDSNHIKQTEHSNAERLIKRFPTFESFLNDSKTKEAMTKNGKTEAELRTYYENSVKLAEPPHVLYTVEIPDDNGKNYLDWDGELSRKQADTIRKRLYEAVLALNDDYKGAEKYLAQDLSVIKEGSHIGDTYGTISDYLSSDKAASEFLHDLGYTGIKVHAAHNSNDALYKDNWNYVIFNDKDLKITDKVKFFRTADGEAYGFTVGGKIYIDPRIATSETPIHEYAHLWAEALRKANPKEWQNVVGLMKGTWAWDYVRQNYPELTTDDEIAEEALAHFSGKQGAERLRTAAKEEADKAEGIMDKASIWSAFTKVREALRKFWHGVADFLHVHFTSAEEVADKVLQDLLEGFNPKESRRGNRKTDIDSESDAKKGHFLFKGKPVSELTGTEFGDLSKDLKEEVLKYFIKWKGSVEHPNFGKVVLDKRGIKDDISHGMNRQKAASFVAVPYIIRDGVIIDEQLNWKQRNYDSVTFAAPITINKEKFIGIAIVKRQHSSNHFYLHTVLLQKSLQGGMLRTGTKAASRQGDIANILNNLYNAVIKSENLSLDAENPNGEDIKYRSVKQGPLLDFLNGQPTRKGFRYAQWANFGVLPPMTAKVDGEWRPPMIFSQWEQSEEGMRKANGKADLVQGNGRTTGDVAYNPYFHIRTSPLNDQFTAAYDRPELVVVEGEYPVSELTSGYHAPGAKNSVGLMDWHSGSVNGQLSDDTKVQTMLSRYFKPGRIVPWSEVADRIMERIGDQDIIFPINAVPPMLRAELAKRGAKFGEISGQVKEEDIPMLEDLRKRINAGEWDAGLDKVQAYLDAYESSDEAKEARVEQISAELNTPIKVVKNPEEIASLPSRRKRMAKGWFEESTGEVVVMLPNNVNVADVDNTVVHEVVGHNGLRKLIGEERFNEFLDEVHEHAGGTVRKAIDKIEKRLVDNEVDRLTREKEAEPDRPNNRKGVFARAEATVEAEKKRQEFRREATEEYMADMAGRIGNEGFKKMDQEELTLWGRIKAKVQKFLDRFLQRLHIATSVKLSDKDVAYILYKSWKRLRNGGKPTIVDMAEDELMRSRTHYDEVGEVHGAGEAVKSGKPHKKSVSLGKDYKGFTQTEFDDFKKNHIGKKIEDENIDKFLSTIKQASDVEPEILPYSRENYAKLFGKGVDTPIGHVKMSANQEEKMEDKSRTKYFSLARPTLENPDFILEKPSNAKDGQVTERPSSYIFVKTFRNADNTYVTYYNAVSVKKDGLEVVQSNYMPYENQVKGSIKGSTLIHLKSVALPSASDTTVQGNQRAVHVGGSSAAKIGNNVESGVKKSEKVGEGGENTGKGAAVVQQRTEPNPTEHVTTESDTSADGSVMFRDGDSVEYTKAQARNLYEERVSRGLYQAQEALQDSMLGLREAMESILKAEGGYNGRIEDVADYENPYLGENRLSSVNQAECAAFAQTLFKPMLEEVARLAKTADERARLTDYMMAKHGLERNEVMARRAAEKAARDEFMDELRAAERTAAKDPLDQDAADVLADVRQRMQDRVDELYAENRGRDYAGLTALTGKDDVADAENEAAQMVSDYEADHDTTNLWDKVNAVTKATLQKTYESGIIGKATYDDISAMYKHYIPLRGFDKKTSDEAYAYLTDKHSAFNAPIKCAKGRKSKADDPFANMEAMAESAIMQGNRNMLVKRKFMRFAQMHPSDLVSISDLWLHYDDAADEWRPVNSGDDVKGTERIEEDDTPREVERKMRDFEEVMRQLSENDPDHFKRQKDNPEIPYRVVRDRDLREHQVLVKQGGKDYVLTINGNPRAAQALNGQTNPDNDMSGALGAILHFGEVINRQLSAFYTTRNPDFTVSNFMRDMLYANTMVWVKESPNYAIRFHKNFAKVNPAKMKMLLTKLRKGTLDMNDETEKAFSVFMANGGETGYSNIRDIEQRKNDIRRELKMYNGKLPFRKAWTLFCERLDEYNRAVENCARFAAFITSRQMKRSLGRSIWDAKEISVNFNKKGSGAKFMGATGQTKIGNTAAFVSGLGRSGFVFWNAAVQGTTNFGRQFKNHPAKALAAAATMFLLGALVSGIASDDDVDNKSSYYNLPEYVRRSNIVFRLPGMKESWISIPLSVEYRAWYGMGELMMSVISGNEHYTSGELAGQMASQVSQLLPIDFMEGGGGFKAFVPSSVKPFAEVMTNKSWTGMPLYKDTPWNKNMPEWTKAYKSANKQLVGLSKALNEVSGGDAYTSGAIDINPAQVEYLLNGYFGGVSSTIDKLVKTGETALGQKEYDPRSFLILNRLVKSGDERTEYRHINNEYFRLKQEHDKLKARLKHYEDDTYNGVFDYAEKINWLNNSPEYQRLEIFEDYSPDINEINNELKEPMNDNERKQLEKELYMLKKELVEESNKTRK